MTEWVGRVCCRGIPSVKFGKSVVCGWIVSPDGIEIESVFAVGRWVLVRVFECGCEGRVEGAR